ncbi:hypothetical protein H5410_018175 [Solanum commersonii]|uniref:DUF295 domain-containing protein n=1 Tax=Solanum commersonii TaxID=4109 RepID=A0A9J6A2L1_SOLCO|nr:hypothetical protein H5410_018175 [Solanum commersonii]
MILNKRTPKASGKRYMESMGVEIELPHQNTTLDHETGEKWIFIHKADMLYQLIHLIMFNFVSVWRLEMDQNSISLCTLRYSLPFGVKLYIVESLFVVVRCGVQLRPVEGDSNRIPLTQIIYEDDAEYTCGTTRNKRYRGQSSVPGLKPNHVYFIDDYCESYLAYVDGGGLDMGVFN